MLSQEWAAIRTMLGLPDEEQEGPRDWHWADYWTAMYCGGWKWCESVSSCWLKMIEPNDTMKMVIGKKAIIQRNLTSKISVCSYNALSVNCEHDWKALPPYTNSSPKESPHLQLTILAFVWSSGLILLKNYCLQSAYESAICLCQSGVIFCVDNGVYSISQCLGRPGLTNIKLHWYDLNHQLHLQINTLVLVTIIT